MRVRLCANDPVDRPELSATIAAGLRASGVADPDVVVEEVPELSRQVFGSSSASCRYSGAKTYITPRSFCRPAKSSAASPEPAYRSACAPLTAPPMSCATTKRRIVGVTT